MILAVFLQINKRAVWISHLLSVLILRCTVHNSILPLWFFYYFIMAALTNQMMTKWSYNQYFKEPIYSRCLYHSGGVVLYSPSKVYHTRVVYCTPQQLSTDARCRIVVCKLRSAIHDSLPHLHNSFSELATITTKRVNKRRYQCFILSEFPLWVCV